VIVGERFVWAHIPKTGGDATATMIQRVPRLVVTADPLGDHAKHLSFHHRRESIAGKPLVANIRRLPAWALSYMRHREQYGQWPDYKLQPYRPAHVVAAESVADEWLDEIVGGYEVDYWIRQEHLTDDLVRVLGEVAALTEEEEARIRSVGRVNQLHRPRLRYWKRSPERFFKPAHIEKLYANNPRWAAIEGRVYG